MKRLAVFALAAALACFICGCELADPNIWPFALESATDKDASSYMRTATPTDPLVQSIRDRGELRIVTCADYPPYEYADGEGIAGIDVYVMERIASGIGVHLAIVNAVSFDDVFVKLDSGEADMAVAGIRPTLERGADYIVSDTYYTAVQYVFERTDGTAAADDAFTVLHMEGDAMRFPAEQLYPQGDIVQFDDLDAMLNAFAAGEGDALIGNAYVRSRLESDAGARLVKTVDGAAQSAAVLLRGGDGGELAELVNGVIRTGLDSGVMDGLYIDYMRSVFG